LSTPKNDKLHCLWTIQCNHQNLQYLIA
jgi:hypothetical protein